MPCQKVTLWRPSEKEDWSKHQKYILEKGIKGKTKVRKKIRKDLSKKNGGEEGKGGYCMGGMGGGLNHRNAVALGLGKRRIDGPRAKR